MTTSTEQHDTARTHPAPCNWDGGANCTCPPKVTGEVPDETDDGPGWVDGRIANLRGLEEAGRKVVEAEAQIALNDAAASAEQAVLLAKLEAVTQRLEAANAPFEKRAERYRGYMLGFMDQNRAEVLRGLPAKLKSRTLVCGLTVAYRKRDGGYRLDQSMTPTEAKVALLAWCAKEEDVTGETLTKPNPVPDLDEIKRHLAAFKAQGEPLDCPPGLEWVEPGETLSVTTKGESK